MSSPIDHLTQLAGKKQVVSDKWDAPKSGRKKYPISTPGKDYIAKINAEPEKAKSGRASHLEAVQKVCLEVWVKNAMGFA